MLIKFKDGDPRAGMTARMDSSRGQALVDSGAAVAVKENGTLADASVSGDGAGEALPPASNEARDAPAAESKPTAKTSKAKK